MRVSYLLLMFALGLPPLRAATTGAPAAGHLFANAVEGFDEPQRRFIIAVSGVLLLTALVIILLVNRERLRRAEQGLHERLRDEQLMSGVSAALINAPPERMDREIERALERVRLAEGLDRCVLFDFHPRAKLKRITHRAEAPHCAPMQAELPVAALPWFFRQLQEGRVVALADAAQDLPAEAGLERAFCVERRICAVLVMPIRQAGQINRWIGCYTEQRARDWPEDLRARLHVIGEILVSALAGAHSELALRQSEQLNRDILSSLNEQVALIDRNGTIQSVNQSWYRYVDQESDGPTAVLGANYLEVCRRSAERGNHGAESVRIALERVLSGEQRNFEAVFAQEFPPPSGMRWFRMTITPYNTPGGGAVVVHSDITEHQRLHEALIQSEERYREVVESQTELVCRYRADTVLTFVNEAYCRFFGRTRESLIGHPFLTLIPASSHAAVREQIESMARDHTPRAYDHEVLLPDGTVRWQHWTDHPILNERGEVEEFQAIGVDITDRKRAEEANRNLAHAARLAVAGELTASIAHEINQPLGAILSNADAAEMLLERPAPPLDEIRQILADIRRDDLRASDVIRHLRSLLRKRELVREPVDMNEMIVEVLRLAAADGQRRRVRFVREFALDLPPVLGDRVHLQQLILNLVLNAMDAMADIAIERRQLVLETRRAESGIEVAVIDAGHGIPAEQMASIFESFFTTKSEGMGLGLSIARSIVEAHQGQISARANAAHGTTFSVRLPAAPSA